MAKRKLTKADLAARELMLKNAAQTRQLAEKKLAAINAREQRNA
jgi:hypothetical protein